MYCLLPHPPTTKASVSSTASKIATDREEHPLQLNAGIDGERRGSIPRLLAADAIENSLICD
jgi:hypothetical protein